MTNRIVRLGILAGAAYLLTKTAIENHEEKSGKDEPADAETKEQEKQEESEHLRQGTEKLMKNLQEKGQEAVGNARESISGYADAIVNEYHRQKGD